MHTAHGTRLITHNLKVFPLPLRHCPRTILLSIDSYERRLSAAARPHTLPRPCGVHVVLDSDKLAQMFAQMLPHANTFWGVTTPTRAHSGSYDRWLNKKHLVLISGLSRAIRNKDRNVEEEEGAGESGGIWLKRPAN